MIPVQAPCQHSQRTSVNFGGFKYQSQIDSKIGEILSFGWCPRMDIYNIGQCFNDP